METNRTRDKEGKTSDKGTHRTGTLTGAKSQTNKKLEDS